MNNPNDKQRHLIPVKLTKEQTADGFWRIDSDKTHVGREYKADVATVRVERFLNAPTGKFFDCQVVDVLEVDTGLWKHFPVEMLEFPPGLIVSNDEEWTEELSDANKGLDMVLEICAELSELDAFRRHTQAMLHMQSKEPHRTAALLAAAVIRLQRPLRDDNSRRFTTAE